MSKLPGNPFGRKQQPGTGLLQEQGVRSDDYLEDEPAAPEPTRSAASQPGVPVAPPPPVQAAPLPPPPPPVAMGVPLSAGAAPDMSDATTGAWGTQRPAQGVWGLSSSDSGPAGYPPPSYSSGAYAPPTYSQQAAWAGPSDQPQYASFEQSAAAAQPPLRCAGWGEQWVLFLCGIIIWPLW